MDDTQKARLEKQRQLQRGAAIIEGTQEQFRQDGYSNMLNKYGTAQDNSTAYTYTQEPFVSDMELTRLYEGNGLFAKIIDRPSEEAVKHGYDIDFGDTDVSEYIEDRMDSLQMEDKFATAEKWARLYGGAIIVMLVDDGRGLEEPLNWSDVRSIEELRVFERAVVQPDYTNLYHFNFADSMDGDVPFGVLPGIQRIWLFRCASVTVPGIPERTPARTDHEHQLPVLGHPRVCEDKKRSPGVRNIPRKRRETAGAVRPGHIQDEEPC